MSWAAEAVEAAQIIHETVDQGECDTPCVIRHGHRLICDNCADPFDETVGFNHPLLSDFQEA